MKSTVAQTTRARTCVLVVDDERDLQDLVGDVVGRIDNCRVLTASSVAEAQRVIRDENVELLLLDVQLPDGNGMSLVPSLREAHPTAEAVVMTGQASLDGAIGALRAGAIDFLPKPFSADQLRERVRNAIARQQLTAKIDKRLLRLRSAVRGLNKSRRMVSKKVDLLCNDLVGAYGELSKQLEGVRTQESFRKLANSAKDLEQLLCHAMDWILRHAGYSNVAIWLQAEQGECELGAYMKYTVPGEKEFTESMKNGLLPLVQREGFVHLQPEDIAKQLTECESHYLAGQTIVAANCTYLGETLATFIAFRDSRSPFSEEDCAMMKAISPIFATTLASVVRKAEGDDDDFGGGDDDGGDDDGGGDNDNTDNPFFDDSRPEGERDDRDDDSGEGNFPTRGGQSNRRRGGKGSDERRRKRDDERRERHSADWWKRGEPPPF